MNYPFVIFLLCTRVMLCRAGLNEMYGASMRSFETERKLRHQLEQEVDMHRVMREEKEVCVRDL